MEIIRFLTSDINSVSPENFHLTATKLYIYDKQDKNNSPFGIFDTLGEFRVDIKTHNFATGLPKSESEKPITHYLENIVINDRIVEFDITDKSANIVPTANQYYKLTFHVINNKNEVNVPGPHSLAFHTGTEIAEPANEGDVLQYNLGKWKNTPASAIDVTTASNEGLGAGQLFIQKTGNNLEFKTLTSSAGITIENNPDSIDLKVAELWLYPWYYNSSPDPLIFSDIRQWRYDPVGKIMYLFADLFQNVTTLIDTNNVQYIHVFVQGIPFRTIEFRVNKTSTITFVDTSGVGVGYTQITDVDRLSSFSSLPEGTTCQFLFSWLPELALDELFGVNLTNQQPNDTLVYNGIQWVNQPQSNYGHTFTYSTVESPVGISAKQWRYNPAAQEIYFWHDAEQDVSNYFDFNNVIFLFIYPKNIKYKFFGFAVNHTTSIKQKVGSYFVMTGVTLMPGSLTAGIGDGEECVMFAQFLDPYAGGIAPPGATALNDLTDVNTTPANRMILRYSGTPPTGQWIASTETRLSHSFGYNPAQTTPTDGQMTYIVATRELYFDNNGVYDMHQIIGSNIMSFSVYLADTALSIGKSAFFRMNEDSVVSNENLGAYTRITNVDELYNSFTGGAFVEPAVVIMSSLTVGRNNGGGVGEIFKEKLEDRLIFKTITSTGLNITNNLDTVDISYTPPTYTLNDLADVTIGTPQDRQVLKYNSGTGQWINSSEDNAYPHRFVYNNLQVVPPSPYHMTYISATKDLHFWNTGWYDIHAIIGTNKMCFSVYNLNSLLTIDRSAFFRMNENSVTSNEGDYTLITNVDQIYNAYTSNPNLNEVYVIMSSVAFGGNIGGGTGQIYKNKVEDKLIFKTINSTDLTIVNNTDTIDISHPHNLDSHTDVALNIVAGIQYPRSNANNNSWSDGFGNTYTALYSGVQGGITYVSWKMFDNNNTTYHLGSVIGYSGGNPTGITTLNGISGEWWKLQINNAKVFNKLDIRVTPEREPGAWPRKWVLMGSNDNSNWTILLDNRAGDGLITTFADYASTNYTKAFTFTNSLTYTFYAMSITQIGDIGLGGNSFAITEVNFYEPPLATNSLLKFDGNNWVNALKSNYTATAPPTTGDDSADGYEVGSRWFDVTADREYVCLDATSSNAQWKETTTAGNLAPYVVGDILYANTTSSLAKLADVATGNALISGGVGVAPSWGKVGLATHVSGVSISNPQLNQVLLYNGSTAWQNGFVSYNDLSNKPTVESTGHKTKYNGDPSTTGSVPADSSSGQWSYNSATNEFRISVNIGNSSNLSASDLQNLSLLYFYNSSPLTHTWAKYKINDNSSIGITNGVWIISNVTQSYNDLTLGDDTRCLIQPPNVANINELLDVTLTGLSNWDRFVWNGSAMVNRKPTSGQIKINSFNTNLSSAVKPTFIGLTTEQEIVYRIAGQTFTSLNASAFPTTSVPLSQNNGVYADILFYEHGATQADDRFKQNPVEGCIIEYRIELSYTNKTASNSGRVQLRLYNPNSGFSLENNLPLAQGLTADSGYLEFITINDSANVGVGLGYKMGVSSTTSLDLVIDSIVCISRHYDYRA